MPRIRLRRDLTPAPPQQREPRQTDVHPTAQVRDRAVGVVTGLFVAEHAGAPMEAMIAVEVVPGVGIPSDRYATKRGHWSDPQWPDQELTFVEAEAAEALGMEPGALRRNVVTHGVRLDELIGVTFQVGGAVLEGVRICDPCLYIEKLNHRPGLLRDLITRGGLRARILYSGRISVGDAVLVAPADALPPTTE